MARESKVTCDKCGEDITETGAMPRYRIVLDCESLPSNTNYRYAVAISPPIDQTMHFCGFVCLSEWVVGNLSLVEKDRLLSPETP